MRTPEDPEINQDMRFALDFSQAKEPKMNDQLTDKQLKNQARVLREYLASVGVVASHSQMLEGLARVHGHRNLATARASFAPAIVEHSLAATDEWVTRVLWFGQWWNDEHLEDCWYAFPQGTTFDESNSLQVLRQLPRGFRFDPRQTCVSHVYAELPALDAYGIPDRADERQAERVFAAEGFGLAKEGLSIKRQDRGDDGAENYWAEVRMTPQASDALDAAARAHFVSELTSLIRARADDNEFAITRSTLEELAFEECAQADMGEPTQDELAALRVAFGY